MRPTSLRCQVQEQVNALKLWHFGSFYFALFLREQSTQFYLKLCGSELLEMEKTFSLHVSSGLGLGRLRGPLILP